MAMGSSTSPRVQTPSHGWWHTRPHMAGKGWDSLKSSRASPYRPWLMSATYPWMLTWAGQVALQGAVPRLSMAKALGMAWG